MSMVTFTHAPNFLSVLLTPGDTAWHKITLPSALPAASGRANVVVAIACVATGGAAAGSLMYMDKDLASSPGTGFPILPGQTFITTLNNVLWVKATTGSDLIYMAWSW